MRVGDRFHVKLADILINQTPIPWCHEISYLGLVLVAGRKLNYSFHIKKAKYFGAVNSVLRKIGTCNNAGLVLSLMASKCSPILQSRGPESTQINVIAFMLCLQCDILEAIQNF